MNTDLYSSTLRQLNAKIIPFIIIQHLYCCAANER